MLTAAKSGSSQRAFAYSPRDAGGRYERLFSVAITHTYYTQSQGRCSDFRIVPTPAASEVMGTLGLLFRDEGAGFSILSKRAKLPGLLAWLRRQAQEGSAGPEYWSRLTFLLVIDNPAFVGVTALPTDTKPTRVNLYGSNRTAHVDTDPAVSGDTAAILPPGRFMGADALRPVTGSTLAVDLPASAVKVFVTDISGAVVLPTSADKPVVLFDGGPNGSKQVTLDLSDLPYDLYTINVQDAAGQPVGSPFYPRDVVYVPGNPIPMVLLDVLFTQPTPDSEGVYPIPSLFNGKPQPESCGGIAYRLPFDARSTYWNYYVVLQRPGQLGSLAIGDVPGAPPSGVAFQRDPEPELLPNGSLAVKFSADGALPLRQNSPIRLQLTGRWHDQSGDHPIQVSPLAVAPPTPVWPGPAREPLSGTSEMFVFV